MVDRPRDTPPLAGCWIPTVLATAWEGAEQLIIWDRESNIAYGNQKVGQGLLLDVCK